MSPITISTTARIALAGFAALAISLTGAAGMASAKPICETGCSQPLPTKNPRPDVKQMCWVEWGPDAVPGELTRSRRRTVGRRPATVVPPSFC